MAMFNFQILSGAVTLVMFCSLGMQAQTVVPVSDGAMEERIRRLESELADLRAQVRASRSTTAAATPLAQQNLVAHDEKKEEKSTIGSLLGPTSVSGFVDLYYQQNFNNPANRSSGMRSFDTSSNQFGLNLVELIVDKTPDPSNSRTGYRIALGYGQAMNAIYSAEPTKDIGVDQYLKEAYFSYLAPVGKGMQFDFGKYVTPHGAEVIETKDNWNYSRGLLFSYAIPYFHFGMRTKYAFNDKYALTGFITNGWNNTIDNNSGKTYGATFSWTPSKRFSLSQSVMAGPEGTDNNSDWRQMYDTVMTVSPTEKLTLMFNYDYGRGDRMEGFANPVYWTGVSAYAKYAFDSKYSIATRYEYYNDHYGFTTGTAGHVQGVTGTFQRVIANHLLTRLEFRRDIANHPIFTKGLSTPVSSQNTLTAGMVFLFDSREGTK
ncbi:MAG TPA: porin [Terriglobales bacterium]|nr:porin [Terriglobales bacterium]